MPDSSTTQIQHCINQLKTGDSAAVDALIKHAQERLRRLVRKIFHEDFGRLRAVEQTDDVMNSGLLRLLTALRAVQVGTVGEFFRLATLQIRRELLTMAAKYPRERAARSPPNASSSDGVPGGNDRSDDTFEPRSLAFWGESTNKSRLPDNERDVFDLVWYQDLSQRDAAAVLGVSVPTVNAAGCGHDLACGTS